MTLSPAAPSSEPACTIGALAKEFGVTLRAIRFYEDRQLITPRRDGQLRLFSKRDRARLALICRGKRLGFSLREIAAFLALYETDEQHLGQMSFFIDKANERIKVLEAQRNDIDQTLAELRTAVSQMTASVPPPKAQGESPS